MGRIIQFLLDVFRFHKKKVIFVFISTLFFLTLIFPYDDLSEVVSTFVAEKTNNQIFLQFDHLGFQLIPYPALAVENVVVDSNLLPSLRAEKLSLAPSISGMLSFRPGFTAGVRQVWNGDMNLELKAGKKTEQGSPTQNISLEVDHIDLQQAWEAFELPLKLKGLVSGEVQVNMDPSLTRQPEGSLSLEIKTLKFPSGTIPTQMGPVTLPGMSWNQIRLKGHLSGGKLNLEPSDIGTNTDLLNGSIKGELDTRLEPSPTGLVFGAYKFQIEIFVNQKLEKDLAPFLILLSAYKSPSPTGIKYKFKVSGQRFGLPPAFSAAL